MLIKLQRPRFADEYLIFDNVTNVKYSSSPRIFREAKGENGLLTYMEEFMTEERQGDRQCWYCIVDPENWTTG